MKNVITHLGLALILTFLAARLHAETWQFGVVAENSRSPFIGDQRETNALPGVTYIGDRFSYSGGEIQYRIHSGTGFVTRVVGQVRQRQFYSANGIFDDDLEIDGMDDRDTAFELGLNLNLRTTMGQIDLKVLFDMTNTHEGHELTAKYSYPIQIGRWMVEPAFGLQLQSDKLVDYYHGVLNSEAQFDRPAYEGDQSHNTMASLVVGYALSQHILAVAGMAQIGLDTNISDSPIVSEKSVQKVYVGFIYSL